MTSKKRKRFLTQLSDYTWLVAVTAQAAARQTLKLTDNQAAEELSLATLAELEETA